MKNRISLMICLVCIALSVAGCGMENKDSDVEILVNEASGKGQETEMEIEDLENPVVSNQDGIDFEELPDDIKGLIIPMDSLLLYYAETGEEYMPENPEMFWRVMHYAIGNFGTFYNRAELVGSELSVESMVIGEFSSAIIADLEEIPAIPDSLSSNVRYDNEEDLYFFGVGDRGLSRTEILSYEYVDNNTLKITAGLLGLEDDSTISQGDFIFTRNEYAAGVMEPLFYFSVSDVTFSEK